MGRPWSLRRVEDGFWRAVRDGLLMEHAAVAAGVPPGTGWDWFHRRGGIAPRLLSPSGRYLSLAEREEIALGLAGREGIRSIARRLGRAPSTVSREIARNSRVRRPVVYRAVLAQSKAEARARRPKPGKLAGCARLRTQVEAGLVKRWSPRQIAVRLAVDFPDQPEMRVAHETIYRALYVQGRGGLRRELAVCLRTGRAVRKPRRRELADRRGLIRDRVMISDRPAEAADRAVPGHWEGDLIIGKNGVSAIGTLVERSTRYALLLHLPDGNRAETVRDAMIDTIATLPGHLWRSLTWDQGVEMARHREITIATGLPIYFCDPHSPWQRGSNENTNGLLRQYFPKGTDLSVHTAEHLAAVAVELNGRPRQTLNWRTPAEALNALLSNPFNPPRVATTV
jgi:IS30 family transposase